MARLYGKRLSENNPRIYNLPVNDLLVDPEPLDSASLSCACNNANHFIAQSYRHLVSTRGPGELIDYNGEWHGSTADTFNTTEPLLDPGFQNRITWSDGNAVAFLIPHGICDVPIGPGTTLRKVRVKCRIYCDANDSLVIMAAMTIGYTSPLSGRLCYRESGEASDPEFNRELFDAIPEITTATEVVTLDLIPSQIVTPYEVHPSADGETVVTVPIAIWVGFANGSNLNRIDYISAYEIP